jgi:hypothetical protein
MKALAAFSKKEYTTFNESQDRPDKGILLT